MQHVLFMKFMKGAVRRSRGGGVKPDGNSRGRYVSIVTSKQPYTV